jgi:hypothetical protein
MRFAWCSTTVMTAASSRGVFLSEIGEAKDARWAEYIAELADKGMSRTR